VIAHGDRFTEADCLVWDESTPGPVLPFLAAHLVPPQFPTPVGVLRAIERPTYEQGVVDQIRHERETKGAGTLEELIWAGDLWRVGDDGKVARLDA
jgi:2-oxoglutarate ferredoxin oxidoreductase subunit beta